MLTAYKEIGGFKIADVPMDETRVPQHPIENRVMARQILAWAKDQRPDANQLARTVSAVSCGTVDKIHFTFFCTLSQPDESDHVEINVGDSCQWILNCKARIGSDVPTLQLF